MSRSCPASSSGRGGGDNTVMLKASDQLQEEPLTHRTLCRPQYDGGSRWTLSSHGCPQQEAEQWPGLLWETWSGRGRRVMSCLWRATPPFPGPTHPLPERDPPEATSAPARKPRPMRAHEVISPVRLIIRHPPPALLKRGTPEGNTLFWKETHSFIRQQL